MCNTGRFAADTQYIGQIVGDAIRRVEESKRTGGALEALRTALGDLAPVFTASVRVTELGHAASLTNQTAAQRRLFDSFGFDVRLA
jgi:hypothetical protein